MPANTVNRGYPYPLPGDPTNPPGDIQALAEAVDDDITANLEPVANTPRRIGHMRAGATQIIVPNTEVNLSFEIQFQDTDNMVNTVSAPTQITIRTAGFYMFHLLMAIPTNTSWTSMILRFRRNGTEMYSAQQQFQSTAQTYFNWTIADSFPCAAGDVITATLIHNNAQNMTFGTTRELIGVRMST